MVSVLEERAGDLAAVLEALGFTWVGVCSLEGCVKIHVTGDVRVFRFGVVTDELEEHLMSLLDEAWTAYNEWARLSADLSRGGVELGSVIRAREKAVNALKKLERERARMIKLLHAANTDPRISEGDDADPAERLAEAVREIASEVCSDA